MNTNIEIDDLIKELEKYMSKSDVDEVKKCFLYIKEYYCGMKRLTGDDYIYHPLNVAYILTAIEADKSTICAGLLHEAIKILNISKEDLEKEFGLEVAELVEGVTKIDKINFDVDSPSMIATQRKIFVGLCEDVRVIIIKLADRLHNMRTLWVHSKEVQKEKAKETLQILTPIAHRLGLSLYKSELEDLSLRYLKPEVYFDIVDRLNKTKAERDQAVVTMKEEVSKLLDDNGIKHEIKGRAKSIYSIYKKLDKGRPFSDIYDLLALRVFVDTKEDCYKTLGVIHSKYRPIPKRLKDYIAMPKTNMYQSLHTTVFGLDDMPFEIQIRTYEMDKIAEKGVASHWSYKEGHQTKNPMEEKLQFFRSIIELNNESLTDEEFVKMVKEDFNDTIYVFTPKGDFVELPSGATPIDFAYKVHSHIGDTMVGAIVNGSLVPLDYELHNDDIIKINTSKTQTPSREWINIAKTAQAKNKIKSYFKKIDKEEYIKIGEDLLNKELRKIKIPFNEFLSDENIDKILKELKLSNIEELYSNLGSNKISFNNVYNIIYIEKEEPLIKKVNISDENIKNDIIVDGITDIKVNIASCCKPIPGDNIVGYITKGYGITVHRSVCPNIINLQERIVNVRWNKIDKRYESDIIVTTLKKQNMLVDIISKTTNNNIIVKTVNTYNQGDNLVYQITILVKEKELLDKFMTDLKILPDILDVERGLK